MGSTAPVIGTVETFDPEVGLGTVRSVDGAELAFHCTAITDRTRTIPVGATVSYLPGPTHLGTDEARSVTPLPPPLPLPPPPPPPGK